MGLMGDEIAPPPITRFDIEEAAERIRSHVRHTPTLYVGSQAGADVLTLKLEMLQVTGSFKPRGAFNRMLAAEVGQAGVLAASGGSFGLAVAHAARVLGHNAEIFVPDTSPSVKIQRIRDEGARVHIVHGYYAEAAAACEERSLEVGALLMHAYDQPEIVAGQGTIAMELEAATLDTVLVAVGGAGLIGGIAAWFGGEVRVVGVETGSCPTLHAALAAGEPVDVDVGGVAADSLGARRVGLIGFEIASRFVDRVVLVPDDAIEEAQHWLWRQTHVIAEPGAAAPMAALLTEAYVPEPGEHVCVLVSGANTNPATVAD